MYTATPAIPINIATALADIACSPDRYNRAPLLWKSRW
jgi:hypothetical protein